jgi:agmatinase
MSVAATFLDAPSGDDLDALEADVAVVGLPCSPPWAEGILPASDTAPATIRAASHRLLSTLGNHDFNFDGPVFAGRDLRIVDCGDVPMEVGAWGENARRATDAIRRVLRRGAVPVVLGGDHGVPIPVFRAYEEHGPIHVVQIDAHIDWRDELNGYRDTLSSPMRRASELPWVRGMTQIGIRGVGSARAEELQAARAYGSCIVLAEELHEQGVAAVLEQIPDRAAYYVTIDLDGMDPAIAPGVGSIVHGGVTYFEALRLLQGLARKGRLAGVDVVEVQPERDVRDLTSLLAAQLALAAIGSMAHSGQIGAKE